MSNFVHKVKDAMTDHNKPVTRSQTSDDRDHSATNPFTSDYNANQNAPRMNNPADMGPNANRPDPTGYGTGNAPDSKTQSNQYGQYPSNTATESYASQPSSNARNTSSVPGDTSSSASSADMNAGPHRSNLANKLDPRVDSDLDNRANQAAGSQRGNMGTQGMQSSNMPVQQQQSKNQGMDPSNMPAQQQQQQQPKNQGMNPSNMPAQQQPMTQNVDNHTSSEDNFNKSTQEHRSHMSEPGQSGFNNNQATGESNEDKFSASTQEHKSHKSTSHMTPCTSGATESEPMSENRTAQPNIGGNAAGGSSYNENMGARGPEGVQNTSSFQKPTAGANRPA